jgi:hypothetical protein
MDGYDLEPNEEGELRSSIHSQLTIDRATQSLYMGISEIAYPKT